MVGEHFLTLYRNMSNEFQEENYLVKLTKGFLPNIIIGVIGVSIAVAALQTGYADNRKRIDTLATEKVDKAVIEAELRGISVQLDDIKAGQIRIENLVIQHLSN